MLPCWLISYSQDNKAVFENFLQQVNLFPQEKIHMHTDKDVYIAGDRVWFKSYVVNTLSHEPLSISKYIYIELSDNENEIIRRIKIHSQNTGLYYGYLDLPQNLPQGIYTLRAYSLFMTNLDSDFFFRKSIVFKSHVGFERKAKDIPKASPSFNVGFYPEGGDLISDKLGKVAFEATSSNGELAKITGCVYDSNGRKIIDIRPTHDGMGEFLLNPKSGESYHAVCILDDGLKKTFALPPVKPEGASLFCISKNNRVTIGFNTSRAYRNKDMYLLAHCRAYPFFMGKIAPDKVLTFDTDSLPCGVIHFLLLDKRNNVLSERLLFSPNWKEGYAKTTISPKKMIYGTRENILVALSTELDTTEKASVSISVSDSLDNVQKDASILSDLLLTSDLNGYIQHPNFYFERGFIRADIDLLMLVHGWRRYDVPSLLHGKYEVPKVPLEIGDVVTGSVTSLFRKKAIANAEVSLLSPETGLYAIAKTDSSGHYELSGIDIPDSTNFIVQALSQKRSNNVLITVDEPSFPEAYSINPQCDLDEKNYTVDQKEEENTILLKDIEVNAQANHPSRQASYGLSALADESFSEKQIREIDATCLHELFRRIAGVYVKEDKMYIRGAISIMGVFPAAIAINGVIIDGEYDLHNIQMADVARVDVFKTGATAIWGAAGGSGVLSITLKDGSYLPKEADALNSTHIRPLGYQRPVEFYTPHYEISTERNSTIPDQRNTLYWNPKIELDGKTSAKDISFYSSDRKGSYTIKIEGITSKGRIICNTQNILVK